MRKDKERLKKGKKRRNLNSRRKPRKLTSKVGESSTSSSGLQREEISSDECAVCLCAYQDDFDENSELVREWLQCTNKICAKWMHQDCLRRMMYTYVVYVETSFVENFFV